MRDKNKQQSILLQVEIGNPAFIAGKRPDLTGGQPGNSVSRFEIS
jgi:hypothetical protein